VNAASDGVEAAYFIVLALLKEVVALTSERHPDALGA
jgi:hypothetical protein